MDRIENMYAFKYNVVHRFTSINLDNFLVKVGQGITDIFQGVPYNRSKRMELIELILSAKYNGLDGTKCFENAKTFIRKHVEEIFSRFNFDDHLNGLEEYIDSWNSYHKASENVESLLRLWSKPEERKEMVDPFAYTETPFIPNESFFTIAISVWEKKLLETKGALTGSIFRYLQKKKIDEKRVKTLIKRIFDALAVLETSQKHPEGLLCKGVVLYTYISLLRKHYREESKFIITRVSLYEYIHQCIGVYEHEERISDRFLPGTTDGVMNTLRIVLIDNHIGFLLENFKRSIDFHRPNDLKEIFRMVKHLPQAIDCLKDLFQSHEEIIFYKLRETFEVHNFCETFNAKYQEENTYVNNVFESDTAMMEALDKGISKAFNRTLEAEQPNGPCANQKFVNLLATYCDHFMRTRTNGLDETGLEEKLEHIASTFLHIEDKDVFLKLYSIYLSKRLLHSTTQSMEAEERMINILKSKCGFTYVKSLEKMITDNYLSQELTSMFNIKADLSLTFKIMVLQTGSWPVEFKPSPLLIPQELAKGLQNFNEFYSVTFKARKLHWHHGFSTCDVKLNYLSKGPTLQTSVFVTSILATFNNMESATLEEIHALTNIDSKDLLKYLQFLTARKILLSEGNDGKSKFRLNYQYENGKNRFKLLPTLKEASQEAKEVTKAVMEDRKWHLEALVVRIMKASKRMTHDELTRNVMKQSLKDFVPCQNLIQKVIKGLIGKEYLEMDEKSSDTYNFVA